MSCYRVNPSKGYCRRLSSSVNHLGSQAHSSWTDSVTRHWVNPPGYPACPFSYLLGQLTRLPACFLFSLGQPSRLPYNFFPRPNPPGCRTYPFSQDVASLGPQCQEMFPSHPTGRS